MDSKDQHVDPKDQREILVALTKEHYNQVRHFETQRSAVSNLIVIVTAAILAFVTHDNALTRSDLALTGLLSAVGVFGIAFAAKYYERTKANADRYYAYRNKLDELFFDSKVLNSILAAAAEVTEKECPHLTKGRWMSRIKVHRLWITLHALIAILGFVLTGLILYKTF